VKKQTRILLESLESRRLFSVDLVPGSSNGPPSDDPIITSTAPTNTSKPLATKPAKSSSVANPTPLFSNAAITLSAETPVASWDLSVLDSTDSNRQADILTA
jgi:hypothetical protein